MVLGQILLTPKMDSNANLGGAISQFYAGKSIFITGVTGFCGKVLLHKLLDSCPELENIYVLIRPKRLVHVLLSRFYPDFILILS